MRGSTFFLASTKTNGPISVNLRDKKKNHFSFFSLPLSRSHFPSVPLFFSLDFPSFYPFLSFFLKNLDICSHCTMCPSLIRVRFCPETIYFFLVQFILNELSSSHFLTSEIFIKILSLESLVTYHLKNRKNIPTVSKFNETFLGH